MSTTSITCERTDKLKIMINTRIKDSQKIEYRPFMSLPKESTKHTNVFINPFTNFTIDKVNAINTTS